MKNSDSEGVTVDLCNRPYSAIVLIKHEYSFNKELRKLATCRVNAGKPPEGAAGAMSFWPSPATIWADTNGVLAHEICHFLAGKKDSKIYKCAVIAKNHHKIFSRVLNILFDEYHESLYGQHSYILYEQLSDHHSLMSYQQGGIPVLDGVCKSFIDSVPGEKMSMNVRKASDLVTIADHIYKDVLPKQLAERNLTENNVTFSNNRFCITEKV